MKKILIHTQDEMKKLAEKIAANCRKGDIIGLKGSLGVGKTFFASAFINYLLDKKTTIASPTFNLVYSYDSQKGQIFHFDLYRLKSADELYEIGFEEALSSGIVLIEWPEIAAEFLRKNYTEIEIVIPDHANSETKTNQSRIVTIKSAAD